MVSKVECEASLVALKRRLQLSGSPQRRATSGRRQSGDNHDAARGGDESTPRKSGSDDDKGDTTTPRTAAIQQIDALYVKASPKRRRDSQNDSLKHSASGSPLRRKSSVKPRTDRQATCRLLELGGLMNDPEDLAAVTVLLRNARDVDCVDLGPARDWVNEVPLAVPMVCRAATRNLTLSEVRGAGIPKSLNDALHEGNEVKRRIPRTHLSDKRRAEERERRIQEIIEDIKQEEKEEKRALYDKWRLRLQVAAEETRKSNKMIIDEADEFDDLLEQERLGRAQALKATRIREAHHRQRVRDLDRAENQARESNMKSEEKSRTELKNFETRNRFQLMNKLRQFVKGKQAEQSALGSEQYEARKKIGQQHKDGFIELEHAFRERWLAITRKEKAILDEKRRIEREEADQRRRELDRERRQVFEQEIIFKSEAEGRYRIETELQRAHEGLVRSNFDSSTHAKILMQQRLAREKKQREFEAANAVVPKIAFKWEPSESPCVYPLNCLGTEMVINANSYFDIRLEVPHKDLSEQQRKTKKTIAKGYLSVTMRGLHGHKVSPQEGISVSCPKIGVDEERKLKTSAATLVPFTFEPYNQHVDAGDGLRLGNSDPKSLLFQGDSVAKLIFPERKSDSGSTVEVLRVELLPECPDVAVVAILNHLAYFNRAKTGFEEGCEGHYHVNCSLKLQFYASCIPEEKAKLTPEIGKQSNFALVATPPLLAVPQSQVELYLEDSEPMPLFPQFAMSFGKDVRWSEITSDGAYEAHSRGARVQGGSLLISIGSFDPGDRVLLAKGSTVSVGDSRILRPGEPPQRELMVEGKLVGFVSGPLLNYSDMELEAAGGTTAAILHASTTSAGSFETYIDGRRASCVVDPGEAEMSIKLTFAQDSSASLEVFAQVLTALQYCSVTQNPKEGERYIDLLYTPQKGNLAFLVGSRPSSPGESRSPGPASPNDGRRTTSPSPLATISSSGNLMQNTAPFDVIAERPSGIRKVIKVVPVDDITVIELNGPKAVLARVPLDIPANLADYLPPEKHLKVAPYTAVTDPDSLGFIGGSLEVEVIEGQHLGDYLYLGENKELGITLENPSVPLFATKTQRQAALSHSATPSPRDLEKPPSTPPQHENEVNISFDAEKSDAFLASQSSVVGYAQHQSPPQLPIIYYKGKRVATIAAGFGFVKPPPLFREKYRKRQGPDSNPQSPVEVPTQAPPSSTFLTSTGGGSVGAPSPMGSPLTPGDGALISPKEMASFPKTNFLRIEFESFPIEFLEALYRSISFKAAGTGMANQHRLGTRKVEFRAIVGDPTVEKYRKFDPYEPIRNVQKVIVCEPLIAPTQGFSYQYKEGSGALNIGHFNVCDEHKPGYPAWNKGYISMSFINGGNDEDRFYMRTLDPNISELGLGMIETQNPIIPTNATIPERLKPQPLDEVEKAKREGTPYVRHYELYNSDRAFVGTSTVNSREIFIGLREHDRRRKRKDEKEGQQPIPEPKKPAGKKSKSGRRDELGASEANAASFRVTANTYSSSPGLASLVPLKRRDIQSIVRLLTYENRSSNPTTLRKILLITINDGNEQSTTHLVIEITILTVDDATEIMRANTGVLSYRHGFEKCFLSLYADCWLDDPDTEYYNGGTIMCTLTAGWQEGDLLHLLTPVEQARVRSLEQHDPFAKYRVKRKDRVENDGPQWCFYFDLRTGRAYVGSVKLLEEPLKVGYAEDIGYEPPIPKISIPGAAPAPAQVGQSPQNQSINTPAAPTLTVEDPSGQQQRKRRASDAAGARRGSTASAASRSPKTVDLQPAGAKQQGLQIDTARPASPLIEEEQEEDLKYFQRPPPEGMKHFANFTLNVPKAKTGELSANVTVNFLEKRAPEVNHLLDSMDELTFRQYTSGAYSPAGSPKSALSSSQNSAEDVEEDPTPDVPLDMVAQLLRCVTYSPAVHPMKVRTGGRAFMARIFPNEEAEEGKLKITAQVSPTLLTTIDRKDGSPGAPVIYRKKMGSIHPFSKILILADILIKQGYVAVEIVDGFRPKDDIIKFNDIGTSRPFQLKNEKKLYTIKELYCGQLSPIIDEASDCVKGFVLNFETTSRISGSMVQTLLRSFTYTNASPYPCEGFRKFVVTFCDGTIHQTSVLEFPMNLELDEECVEATLNPNPVVFMQPDQSSMTATTPPEGDTPQEGNSPAPVMLSPKALSSEAAADSQNTSSEQHPRQHQGLVRSIEEALDAAVPLLSDFVIHNADTDHGVISAPGFVEIEGTEGDMLFVGVGTTAIRLSEGGELFVEDDYVGYLHGGQYYMKTQESRVQHEILAEDGSVKSPEETSIMSHKNLGKPKIRMYLDDCPYPHLQTFLRSVYYAREDFNSSRRIVKLNITGSHKPLYRAQITVDATEPMFQVSDTTILPTGEVLNSVEVKYVPKTLRITWEPCGIENLSMSGSPNASVKFSKSDTMAVPPRDRESSLPGSGLRLLVNTRAGVLKKEHDYFYEKEKFATIVTNGMDGSRTLVVDFHLKKATTVSVQKLIRSIATAPNANYEPHDFTITFEATPFAITETVVRVAKEVRRHKSSVTGPGSPKRQQSGFFES